MSTAESAHRVLEVDFCPSVIQAIILISLSYINDKTTLSYIFISKSVGACRSLLILATSLVFLTMVYLFIGYTLHIIIQPSLLDWMSILFFFISSLYYLSESFYSKGEITFSDELITMPNANNSISEKMTRKHSLTVITEVKEDSKYTDDLANAPLLNNPNSKTINISISEDGSGGYSYVQENEEDNAVVYETIKKTVYEKYNDFTFMVLMWMCAVYDYVAVVIGAFVALSFILLVSSLFGKEMSSNLHVRTIMIITGALLLVYSMQLYLFKALQI